MNRFPHLAGLFVLLVDDDDDMRTLYSLAFQREVPESRVITATNGVEAIEACAASLPDVVIMDMSMPVMTGLEATGRIKADPRTAHIPVLALTGSIWDEQKVLGGGCDAYLTKPCFVEDLLAEIQRVFDRQGLRPRANPA
jgi:two-component system, cell cycle response regulator DivK